MTIKVVSHFIFYHLNVKYFILISGSIMADIQEVPDEIFNNGELVASKHENCIILDCQFMKKNEKVMKVKANENICDQLNLMDTIKNDPRKGSKDIFLCIAHIAKPSNAMQVVMRTKNIPVDAILRSFNFKTANLVRYWRRRDLAKLQEVPSPMNRSQPVQPIVPVQPVQPVQDLVFDQKDNIGPRSQPSDPKDEIISALEDTVRKLQVQNIEKDAIIKSQEDIIKKLTEQVNSLMKNTTSSSLSKPPLALEDISNTKFDEDSDDMVPKL
jgi:hypothetical protein